MFMILFLFFAAVYSVPQDLIILDLTAQKVLLSCPTKEDSDFVLWFVKNEKTGKDQELGFSDRYFFPSLKEVEIRGIKTEDSGEYKCKTPFTQEVIKIFQVKINEKTVESTDVTKIPAPKWVLLPSPVKTIDNRRAAIIPCRATGVGVKTKAYKLKLSGEILYELPQSGVVLHKPKEEDSGKYLCVAENPGGKLSHQFELLVRVNGGVSEWADWGPCDAECGFGVQSRSRTCTNPRPANGGSRCRESMTERQRCRERGCSTPRLVKFGYDMTDGNLKLDCHAKGIPKPSILWRFDGKLMDSQFDYRNAHMVIPKHMAKSGSYSCTIRNDVGYFTMYISIDI